MIWPLSILVGLLIVLAITAATAYFVAQEFAYMSVDRASLTAAATAGDARAAKALAITRRTSFLLSGAQLGITVTGLLVGYVAEPLIGAAIGDALGGVNVPTGVGIAIGTVLALLLSTFIQMLFGELFPKNLAISNPRPIAERLAGSTRWYLLIFGPVIKVFDGASNLLLKSLRIEPVHDVEYSATTRDLEHIVAESRDSGDLRPELSLLLDRILEFPDETVEHAMIPRVRADSVGPQTTLREVRDLMAVGHSRYPVVDGEEVLGVVQLTDVLGAGDRLDEPVTALMQPPNVVPSTMRLPDALRTMGQKSNRMLCVIDEYGGFAGVVTGEDLAEELIGEIDDEHGTVPDPYKKLPDGSWELPGEMPVDEVERILDRDLPEGHYETLAGLVIEELGTLPDVGQQIRVLLPGDPADYARLDELPGEILLLRVLEVERHVPARLRLSLSSISDTEPTEPDGTPEPDGGAAPERSDRNAESETPATEAEHHTTPAERPEGGEGA